MERKILLLVVLAILGLGGVYFAVWPVTALAREPNNSEVLLPLVTSGDQSAEQVNGEVDVDAQARVLLKNDFLIHSTPYFENTAKVIPPSPGCPQGRIVVSTGQTSAWNTGKILHRPLYDRSSPIHIDTTSPTVEVEFPTGSTKAIATDNHTVRLKDGSMLIFRDGFSWDDISPNPPEWLNETVTGFGNHKGQRGGPLIFRSTDCGVSWVLHSTIDLATLLGGKYGFPRPMDDNGVTLDTWLARGNDPKDFIQGKYPDGSLKWFAAGADRTEVYSCPFTGHLYLTTRVISGPYPYTDITQSPLDTALLLYSKDNGKTWELIKEDLPSWSPIVMTSTPNGRLFLFHLVGSQPMVYFSKTPVTAGQKPDISQGYPVYYVENGKNVPNATANPADVDLFYQAFHPSISRVSTGTTSSQVRAAYHAVNSHGMQETPVITIDVQDPNKAPVVRPVRVIRANDPKDYSVLYFNFIDPDYIDLPVETPSNTGVAYWIEVPRPGLTDKKYAIRAEIFEGDFNVSCSAYLSLQDGKPRTWSTRQDLGDYMTGGFFWSNNKLNYLAQWVEPTGIRANIVRLPHLSNNCQEANLRIDKSDTPDPVVAGEQLVYTILVTNDGPDAATDVTVVDMLPAEVAHLSNTGGCIEAPVGTLTCPLGNLGPGTTSQFQVTVRVAPDIVFNAGAPTLITNSAEVTSTALDENSSDNSVSEDTKVFAAADLEILSNEVVGPPAEVLVGEEVDVTLRKVVTNHGPSAPVDIVLTVTATAPADSSVFPSVSSFNEPALGLGEQRQVLETFRIVCGRLGTHGFSFTNEIQPAHPADTDPDPANNSASLSLNLDCVDPIPPTVTASAHPSVLWPPNGKLAPVVVSGQISDAHSGVDPGSATYRVVDEYGLVQPSGSVAVQADGRYSVTILLEASRRGQDQNGRRYTVIIEARDLAGNLGSASAEVVVPHDRGH